MALNSWLVSCISLPSAGIVPCATVLGYRNIVWMNFFFLGSDPLNGHVSGHNKTSFLFSLLVPGYFQTNPIPSLLEQTALFLLLEYLESVS